MAVFYRLSGNQHDPICCTMISDYRDPVTVMGLPGNLGSVLIQENFRDAYVVREATRKDAFGRNRHVEIDGRRAYPLSDKDIEALPGPDGGEAIRIIDYAQEGHERDRQTAARLRQAGAYRRLNPGYRYRIEVLRRDATRRRYQRERPAGQRSPED